MWGQRAHATLRKRAGVESPPHLKPRGDLIFVEWLQPDCHGTVRDPGTIGNCGPACHDDGQRPSLVGFPFLEGQDTQQEISLGDAGGLQQLIKPVEHQDRQRAIA
jgi:hypothetical protein